MEGGRGEVRGLEKGEERGIICSNLPDLMTEVHTQMYCMKGRSLELPVFHYFVRDCIIRPHCARVRVCICTQHSITIAAEDSIS